VPTVKTYVHDIKRFCEHYDITPFQLVNAERLAQAQKRMQTEMSMQASQEFEFIKLQIKRHVEKLAEQYVETFKVRNGNYVKGKNLAPKTLPPNMRAQSVLDAQRCHRQSTQLQTTQIR
jgi:hypothetical protein